MGCRAQFYDWETDVKTAMVKDRREEICKIKMGKECELLQGLVKGLPRVLNDPILQIKYTMKSLSVQKSRTDFHISTSIFPTE